MDSWQGRYPCVPERASHARGEIVSFAQRWFDGDALFEVAVAAGEALVLAFMGTKCEYVSVTCAVFDHTFVVDVIDESGTLEFADTYGLVIMHHFMDEIEYRYRNARSIRLTKHIPRR